MRAIITLSLIILILFSPFFMILSLHNVFFSYEHSSLPISDFQREEYISYTGQVIRYLFNFSKSLVIINSHGERLDGFFAEDEIQHMKDVKTIFEVVSLIYVLSLLLIAFFFKKIKTRDLILSGEISIILLALLLFAVSLNFNKAFILFHKIFFRNNLWLLPYDSNLIKLFPEGIFLNFSEIWFVTSFTIALFIAIYSRVAYFKRVKEA